MSQVHEAVRMIRKRFTKLLTSAKACPEYFTVSQPPDCFPTVLVFRVSFSRLFTNGNQSVSHLQCLKHTLFWRCSRFPKAVLCKVPRSSLVWIQSSSVRDFDFIRTNPNICNHHTVMLITWSTDCCNTIYVIGNIHCHFLLTMDIRTIRTYCKDIGNR